MGGRARQCGRSASLNAPRRYGTVRVRIRCRTPDNGRRMSDSKTARQTPLHDAHVAQGARMVDFAGYRLPVQYTGVLDEHRAVRERLGLFDVSHMGEFLVAGPGSLATIQHLTANDASKLEPGRAQYSLLTTEE